MTKVVFGIGPIKPFSTQIEGKVRIRMRNDDLAMAYVKTASAITQHMILDQGEVWKLGEAFGKNVRRGSLWISVEDELPKEGIPVLITNAHWKNPGGGFQTTGGYLQDGTWYNMEGFELTMEVGEPNPNHHPLFEPPTHWMPMPEPPEKSEGGTE